MGRLQLRAATASGLALDHLFLLPDQLRKAANYRQALEDAGAELECPDYAQIAKQSEAVTALLRSEQTDLDSVRTQLQTLADAVTEPAITSGVQEHKAWVARLNDNSAKARSSVARAIAALAR